MSCLLMVWQVFFLFYPFSCRWFARPCRWFAIKSSAVVVRIHSVFHVHSTRSISHCVYVWL
jgi:hypothetical protein